MVDSNLRLQLLEELERLPTMLQARVLEFARTLSEAPEPPAGTPGTEVLRFAGSLSDEDAAEMLAAINEDCARIDPRDW